jgi:hypothetical protein
MATYPNTNSASDVWSLRDVYKAEAGDEWPSLSPATNVTNIATTSRDTFVLGNAPNGIFYI